MHHTATWISTGEALGPWGQFSELREQCTWTRPQGTREAAEGGYAGDGRQVQRLDKRIGCAMHEPLTLNLACT